ncbi:hypothetical protein PO070_09140 [Bacteroides stercoris]|jgi:hypothetical protein|uniref:hypothetical protein n=1 Tax=Bacteroides stercoris TaxID=46506 RepID=UPI00232DD1AC|nr:hypothetical protein [Bacteroides stercoris]MDC2282627.1 hypothetical protein [Bacteroides stercoris]MDC2295732.1 hypothetical protein [Bacteroides stercoris]
MRLLKGVKMEVNGSRGRFERKLQREIHKKKKRQRERKYCRKRETGQTICKEVYGLSVWPNPFGRANKPFFPVYLLWVTACPIYGRAVTCSFPLPAQKNSKKKKSQKIRKSTFAA